MTKGRSSMDNRCSGRIIVVIVMMVFLCGSSRAENDIRAGDNARSQSDYNGLQYLHSTANETEQQRDQRMEWFRQSRFGLFIHWGLYSQLGGEWQGRVSVNGEWVQNMLSIPTSEYQNLAKTFDPVKYNPKEWSRLFKDAGVKYICITTKHHDGFCLWDSNVNDGWDIAATPYKKDILAPLAKECRKQGITFCIYHSVLDWHHPLWPNRPAFNDVAKGEPDKERFTHEYLYPQLKELFTKYGEIGMIWFDGTWGGGWSSEDGKELEEYTRSLQPSVIINNRSGYTPPQPSYAFADKINNKYGFIIRGDYITPERDVPPVQMPGMDWETCQTMWDQNTWGYHRLAPFRSTKELLHLLIDIVDKGGNLLLNVGPTAEGEIPVQAKELLVNIGRWLKVNGEAIYGTEASPFEGVRFDGRCTRKGNKLYLHIYDWPKDDLIVPLKNKARCAYLLANPKVSVQVNRNSEVLSLTLPDEAPDPIASVVVLEIEGEPAVSEIADPEIGNPNVYKAEQAKLRGIPCEIRIEEYDNIKSIGYWLDASDWVEWTINPKEEAEYDVYLDQACKESSAGSEMTLTVGDQNLDFSVSGTGGDWRTFKTVKIGRVKLIAGEQAATLKAHNKTGEAVINIREIKFERAD